MAMLISQLTICGNSPSRGLAVWKEQVDEDGRSAGTAVNWYAGSRRAPRLRQFAVVFAAASDPCVGRLHFLRTVFHVAGGEELLLSRRSLQNKSSAPENSQRECKQIAFDHHKSLDFHIDLPIVAVVIDRVACARGRGVGTLARTSNLVEPSPPDLQILNSTFLI